MPQPPVRETFLLAGPSGALEALLEIPAGHEPDGIAVVCHPHPLYGGNMHNKVAHTLARAFIGVGFASLRFNFRGTGSSEGEYDEGRGEVDDVLAAAAAARARFPSRPVWLAGFSFGAAMAVHAAVRETPDGLISVAPAVARFAGDAAGQPQCPWLVVQGDRDELVDIDDTVAWIDTLPPGPELLVFPDTEHFFHGKLVQLRAAVEEFVRQHAK